LKLHQYLFSEFREEFVDRVMFLMEANTPLTSGRNFYERPKIQLANLGRLPA